MKWKELVELVDQLFGSVVREEDEEFIIAPGAASRFMKKTTMVIISVPVANLIFQKYKKKKKSA